MADETSTTRSGGQEANVSRPRTRSRGRLRSGTSSSAGGESTEGKPTSPQTGEAVSMQQDDAPALYIGKYKVTHALGKGSFADVYRAEHSETGELVAIKAISIERLNPQARKQLNSEVEILKKFKHENVVKLIDVAVSETFLPVSGVPQVTNDMLFAEIQKDHAPYPGILRWRRCVYFD